MSDTQQQQRRLLILYGSQTGNAQDVAERVAREAALLLYSPAVMPMDAYPIQLLPEERFVVFVTATTGQGDPPDNMRRFWKLLLRKNLPPTILAGTHYAVFGLGDSGYVKYNVAAKKLDRRLSALGAAALLERGLGDDQHPSGYEASLDPWLQQLWKVLRTHNPLPTGVEEPVLDTTTLLQLTPPKYRVTFLTQQPPQHQQQQQQQSDIKASSLPLSSPQQREQALIEQAVAAAAAFRAVAAEASGALETAPQPQQQQQHANGGVPASATNLPQQQQQQQHGPWRPLMAPLLVNRRVTAAAHWQHTRYLELDLSGYNCPAAAGGASNGVGAGAAAAGGSGSGGGGTSAPLYQPGDLLAIFPRTPAQDVEAALQRLGLDGDTWVRIEPAAAAPAAQQRQEQGQQPSTSSSSSSSHAVCEAPLRAIVQGVLDLSGSSPRRCLFQVLSHFSPNELHRKRLQYFATAEGRDDLYRYNQKERRSLLEVLQDFPSAAPPLERLLEAAPLLQPRLFSLASAPAAHGSIAAVLAAVVAWKTVSNRPRRGLVTNWLAGLQPAATSSSTSGSAAAGGAGGAGDGGGGGSSDVGDAVRVPVWLERGAFRLPPSDSTPLLMVGPGTGVAPFRSFCWHRAAAAAAMQQQQQEPMRVESGNSSSSSSSCFFFGCRSPTADFYFEDEWWAVMQSGALHPQHGLIAAFSRHSPQPSQQELLQMLQDAAAASAASAVETRQQEAGAQPAQPSNGSTTSGSSGGSKVYVTHKIKEHGAAVWQLLSQQGAWVYVSGSAEKMPAGVVSALEAVAVAHGGLSAADAAKFVRQLELTGRYHVEAWS